MSNKAINKKKPVTVAQPIVKPKIVEIIRNPTNTLTNLANHVGDKVQLSEELMDRLVREGKAKYV